MTSLPLPDPGRASALEWVGRHLHDVYSGPLAGSGAFVGGQDAADEALARLDITGYARRRSLVDPVEQRGASKLSPYIRHGLLHLRHVWDRVADADGYDRFRYQGELLWQDHSRHWYALYGRATARPIAYEPVRAKKEWTHEPWWTEMECVRSTMEELETDGWAVNQTRMWLASQWTVRAHGDVFVGENEMFRHLLDGSRAANRLGWQWCSGTTRPKAHGFARAQVRKRAPSYCERCPLSERCPIGGYARVETRSRVERPAMIDVDQAFGPAESPPTGAVDAVWLTAESLGQADPALRAHPNRPVHFVFDERLLGGLQLSAKRLVYLVETLAELGTRCDLHLHLGSPSDVLDRLGRIAVTYAPVPGFRRIVASASAATIDTHPWPWLRPPTDAYLDALERSGRPPSFRDWCRLTKPGAEADPIASDPPDPTK